MRVACVIVVALLISAPANAQRPSTAKGAAVARFFEAAARHGQLNGAVLIADAGNVLYRAAFGQANMEWQIANSTDTRFEIASMTKPMTAIMIMQLVEEGRVKLAGHVSDYIPFYPKETGSIITVEHLLQHTSGLQQDIAFAERAADMPIAALINSDALTNDSLVALIARRPLRFQPGTSYGYSSDGYAVLGAIVEHVTHKPYWTALKERVLDRAGMTQTGVSLQRPLVPKRASGYAQTFGGYENAPRIGISPAGGLYSTLADLYKFDQALYGKELMSEASKRLVFTPRDAPTAYGWKTTQQQLPDGTQRLHLRTTGGLPGFTALMVRLPAQQRVIILLSNVRNLVWRFDDFAAQINNLLDGRPYEMPKQSVAEVIAQNLKDGISGDNLEARFHVMRKDTVRFRVTESEMNNLGYYLLSTQPRGALTVFQLNVVAFPGSANVYDSLGEAYMVLGDKANAIANYRKSLSLDPNNSNAVAMLKRLENG